MDAALILAAGLMGLAGTPHCAAMCAAPCAALARAGNARQQSQRLLAFLGGRVLGYAAGGAAVAASVAAAVALGGLAPALRPLWLMLQLAVLGLGGWLLISGRQPPWWVRLGTPRPVAVQAGGWQRIHGPLRAGAAGSLWLALPCGLLQSALLVASLANSPLQGATAMAAFALTSSLGLWLPARWWGRPVGGLAMPGWAVRAAGAALVGAAGWSLAHGVWERVASWCGLA